MEGGPVERFLPAVAVGRRVFAFSGAFELPNDEQDEVLGQDLTSTHVFDLGEFHEATKPFQSSHILSPTFFRLFTPIFQQISVSKCQQ